MYGRPRQAQGDVYGRPQPPLGCVQLTHLPKDYVLKDVHELCAQYGQLQCVRLMSPGLFRAFFSLPEAAKRCSSALGGLQVPGKEGVMSVIHCYVVDPNAPITAPAAATAAPPPPRPPPPPAVAAAAPPSSAAAGASAQPAPPPAGTPEGGETDAKVQSTSQHCDANGTEQQDERNRSNRDDRSCESGDNDSLDAEDNSDSESDGDDYDALPPCILVRGIPLSWTEQQIRLVFALFGGVDTVVFIDGSDSKVAHVKLKELDNTAEVVEKLHNTPVGDGELIEKTTISCELLGGARPRIRKKRRFSQRSGPPIASEADCASALEQRETSFAPPEDSERRKLGGTKPDSIIPGPIPPHPPPAWPGAPGPPLSWGGGVPRNGFGWPQPGGLCWPSGVWPPGGKGMVPGPYAFHAAAATPGKGDKGGKDGKLLGPWLPHHHPTGGAPPGKGARPPGHWLGRQQSRANGEREPGGRRGGGREEQRGGVMEVDGGSGTAANSGAEDGEPPHHDAAGGEKEARLRKRIEQGLGLIREGRSAAAEGLLEEGYEKYCAGLQRLLKIDKAHPQVQAIQRNITRYVEEAERLLGVLQADSGAGTAGTSPRRRRRSPHDSAPQSARRGDAGGLSPDRSRSCRREGHPLRQAGQREDRGRTPVSMSEADMDQEELEDRFPRAHLRPRRHLKLSAAVAACDE